MGINELIGDWANNNRPLLIVDEIRPDDLKRPRAQFCIYTAVVTDTSTAVEIGWSGAGLRELWVPAENRDRAFKGRHLFGNKPRLEHEPIRNFFFAAMSTCAATATLTTDSGVLRADRKRVRGGIRAEPATPEQGPSRDVRGTELVMFMNLIKCVATDWFPGADQVEVLVDRSAQLGLDPAMRRLGTGKIDPSTQPVRDPSSSDVVDEVVEVFGPDHLNTAPGGRQSEFLCESRFRIVSSPETGMFADLLMLPDAVGYLRQKAGGHDAGCDRVRSGEPYWMRYDSTLPFHDEIERRVSRATAADLLPL